MGTESIQALCYNLRIWLLVEFLKLSGNKHLEESNQLVQIKEIILILYSICSHYLDIVSSLIIYKATNTIDIRNPCYKPCYCTSFSIAQVKIGKCWCVAFKSFPDWHLTTYLA